MGCLSRIGCLAVLAAGGGVAVWLYGDRLPSVVAGAASGAAQRVSQGVSQGVSKRVAERVAEPEAPAGANRDPRVAPVGADEWAPLAANGSRSREAIARLARRDGPAYVSLRAPALADLLASAFTSVLPRSAAHTDVAVVNDQLLLRSVVDARDVAGDGALRRVIGLALDARDTLQLAGTLDVVRPGLAYYRVREVRFKGITVPPRLIPSLIDAMHRAAPADSLASGALPIPLPKAVADVRVARGMVTFYKAVAP